MGGNPLGFEEEATQHRVHRRHDVEAAASELDSKLVFRLLDAEKTEISSKPVCVFSLRAAAPEMSGQIIRSLIGKLERIFSSPETQKKVSKSILITMIPLFSLSLSLSA